MEEEESYMEGKYLPKVERRRERGEVDPVGGASRYLLPAKIEAIGAKFGPPQKKRVFFCHDNQVYTFLMPSSCL